MRTGVNAVKSAQLARGYPRRVKAPLKLYNSGSPMERVAIDVLGQLPKTNAGNQYILIAQDYFTKWPKAFAIPDQRAETVADVLVNKLFTRFGIPVELHSDQGRNFEAQTFQEVCRLLGIHKTRITPYHPESDGMVERFNQTLENGLSLFVNDYQTDWDKHIPLLLMAYRTAEHGITKVTPSRMMFGREIKLPVDLWAGRPEDSYVAENGPTYVQQLQDQLDEIHVFAREISSHAMKKNYDVKALGTNYQVGTSVWLHNSQQKREVTEIEPKLEWSTCCNRPD